MQSIEELKQKSDVPVVVADHEGFIRYINPIFTIVLGWQAEDLVGQPLTKVLPGSFRDAHNLAFSRFQATEKATVLNHPIQLKTMTKNQGEIITEHFIIAEKLDDQWFFAAALRPL
jgi:PAS domain S-box-containing protein